MKNGEITRARIGVLWSVLTSTGKISNAGNYLICERGKKLLEAFCGKDLDFVYIERSKPFDNDFDGLIIMGGPLITSKIHEQSKMIIKSIQNKNTPMFCIGIGIAGRKLNSEKDFFKDYESIRFWKHVYGMSNLFSVRDELTSNVLENYGIKAEVTGCPALFDMKSLNKNKILMRKEKINKIAVSIPHFSVSFSIRKNLSMIRPLFLTLYFLYIIKNKFKSKKLGLIFQHGYDNFITRFIQRYSKLLGMKSHDFLGRSLDSLELFQYDAQIGTRLHSHIYFLSMNKPSFLFDVDLRTKGFLKTIETPNEKYTISGIINLINMLSDRIVENNFDEFDEIPEKILKYYGIIKEFLFKIVEFFSDNPSCAS